MQYQEAQRMAHLRQYNMKLHSIMYLPFVKPTNHAVTATRCDVEMPYYKSVYSMRTL